MANFKLLQIYFLEQHGSLCGSWRPSCTFLGHWKWILLGKNLLNIFTLEPNLFSECHKLSLFLLLNFFFQHIHITLEYKNYYTILYYAELIQWPHRLHTLYCYKGWWEEFDFCFRRWHCSHMGSVLIWWSKKQTDIYNIVLIVIFPQLVS